MIPLTINANHIQILSEDANFQEVIKDKRHCLKKFLFHSFI